MFEQMAHWNITLITAVCVVVISVVLLMVVLSQRKAIRDLASQQLLLNEQLSQTLPLLQKLPVEMKMSTEQQLVDLRMKLMRQQAEFHQQTSEQQIKSFANLHQTLAHHAKENREELSNTLSKNINALTDSTDKRLQSISEQVEKRLADGFEKTTKTFNDILKRLALIDDAQQKITELSTNVVSLQEVLADKRSRGAFGEVQLNSLIRNVLPEEHFAIQHTLSNGKVADCVLFLPEPTGNVVVDAKFPLESYRTLTDISLPEIERKQAQRQFKQDIKKHINDIASKYLIERETAQGAVMFIPAEAVFAEIHAHHADLVELANQKRVWLASPTTLMAILTTARAVIKDEATKEQVHIIQAHLSHLSVDFARFRTRFDNLAKHIDQAATDVKQINTSANKIASRFEKIEQVDTSLAHDKVAKIKP
ncbi:DNA recombination protein RmuC [Thalassotalea sp. LPB0316]|uniref:DNA recombination protein RmuC n=1 Tax=Thalassotalea sp. LPB0316 TaxID=2769490 RepID=UPI001866809A|nr:DNA recombination protein RmuC [Thalassotalea sp. LPB0316]QOL25153.1 DNA recombination protein RmuC [Thalassotalea sp. LPB0316]